MLERRTLPTALPSPIFDNGYGSSPSWSPVFRIPHGRRRVGSLLGNSPWMAEEAMDWWLPCSSIFFGQSRRPAAFDPVRTLLECRATPRPRPSMTPSAWWSTLINWAGGCTRMKTKLRKVDHCFSQARSVHRSYGHDSSSSKASWIGLLESHLSCLAYGRSCLPAADVQHVMSDVHNITDGSTASHMLSSLGWC